LARKTLRGSITQTRIFFVRRYGDIIDRLLRRIIEQRVQPIPSTSFGISANFSIGRFSRESAGCLRGLSIIFFEEDIVLRENDNHSDLHCSGRQLEQIKRIFKRGSRSVASAKSCSSAVCIKRDPVRGVSMHSLGIKCHLNDQQRIYNLFTKWHEADPLLASARRIYHE